MTGNFKDRSNHKSPRLAISSQVIEGSYHQFTRNDLHKKVAALSSQISFNDAATLSKEPMSAMSLNCTFRDDATMAPTSAGLASARPGGLVKRNDYGNLGKQGLSDFINT